MTRQWGWGPSDAWNLTWTQMKWWLDQGNRIDTEIEKRKSGK